MRAELGRGGRILAAALAAVWLAAGLTALAIGLWLRLDLGPGCGDGSAPGVAPVGATGRAALTCFSPHPRLGRESEIDSVALVAATSLLALRCFRAGVDVVAAGFRPHQCTAAAAVLLGWAWVLLRGQLPMNAGGAAPLS